MKGLDTLLDSNPAIRKAHRLYRQFTADEQLMEQYESRQKYLRDVATLKGVSYDEGLEKGEQIGLEKGGDQKEIEMVQTMRKNGMTMDAIAQYINLSIERIKNILNPPTDK